MNCLMLSLDRLLQRENPLEQQDAIITAFNQGVE